MNVVISWSIKMKKMIIKAFEYIDTLVTFVQLFTRTKSLKYTVNSYNRQSSYNYKLYPTDNVAKHCKKFHKMQDRAFENIVFSASSTFYIMLQIQLYLKKYWEITELTLLSASTHIYPLMYQKLRKSKDFHFYSKSNVVGPQNRGLHV